MSPWNKFKGGESLPQHDDWAHQQSTPPLSQFSNTIPQNETKASNNGQYELIQQQHFQNSPIASERHLPTMQGARRRSKFTRDWLWEVSSILVAVACFIGVFLLLFTLSNKPVPDWPSGITVNAVLSVLVTIMKAAMALATAECLSQLKWSWFRTERKLTDLIIFDEASRGAWGAGRLLFSLRAWYLAYLGAFVIVAIFVIGPTVQQSVDVRVRQVALTGSNATMPVCNTTQLALLGLGGGPGLNRVEMPVVGAMYDGILQTSSTSSQIIPGCPTGNCTYPRYQSLAVVTECTDITSKLANYYRPPEGLNSTIPFNSTMTPEDCGKQPMNCVSELSAYGIFLDSYGTINSTVNYTLATESPDPPFEDPPFYTWRAILGRGQSLINESFSPSAVECSFRFAVNTYEATVNAGKLSETLISSVFTGSKLQDGEGNSTNSWLPSNNLTMPANPCYIGGEEVQDHSQCTYVTSAGNGLAIMNTLSNMIDGYGRQTVSNRPFFSTDALQAVHGLLNSISLLDPKTGTLEYVDRAFQSLSTTLTNHMRSSNAVCGNATIEGLQWADELYLHVNWMWLISTAVMLVLSVCFFAAVMIKFSGEDLWKSSPLAFLVSKVKMNGRDVSPEELLDFKGDGSGVSPRRLRKVAEGFTVSFGPPKE